MSYINIHRVMTMPSEGELAVPQVGEHNEVASLRDGEEISACVRILQLLDELGSGEAIVITVNIY
jgi:hypothetical protein